MMNKTIAVDHRDLERRSLADTQAASVHEQQGSSGNRVPYAAKDCARLDIGENIGQSSALGRSNSFF